MVKREMVTGIAPPLWYKLDLDDGDDVAMIVQPLLPLSPPTTLDDSENVNETARDENFFDILFFCLFLLLKYASANI